MNTEITEVLLIDGNFGLLAQLSRTESLLPWQKTRNAFQKIDDKGILRGHRISQWSKVEHCEQPKNSFWGNKK